MTREEYKKAAENVVGPTFVNYVAFPILLRECAVKLFILEIVDTDFAKETRRRLLDLEQTGITN